jgi:hypothetical protein
MVNNM